MRDAILDAFDQLNRGDADGFAARVRERFAPDATIVLPQGTTTVEPALASWLGWLDAFAGGRFTTTVFAEGEGTLVLEELITGRQTGPLPLPDGGMLPATGREVQLRSVTLVEHDGARVTGWRAYYDQAALLTQLGLMAQPEPA